ncbi:MAG: aminotransferase class V-fold PLP-dependent enzyme [Flavipsychrobacter sp.]
MQEVKEIQTVDYERVLSDFLKKHPQYSESGFLDELRKKDFSRIEAKDHVYLDFVGGNLYPASLIQDHQDFLLADVYGNPHSENPTSKLATECNEKARAYVKEYFNDKEDEYCVVFTLNASGALKLIGEAYPFTDKSHYALLVDNHNSVNGIREFARCKQSKFTYVPVLEDSLTIDEKKLDTVLNDDKGYDNKLFAYPAQSNFSGVKHDLKWIGEAQERGWDVLLDAAAYAPSNELDLSKYKPEFVSISFYKIFGYPTGIGALLIRKSVLHKMKRPWFAGGTIELASVRGDGHFFADNEVGFEDGTINYLNIPAVEMGLKYIKNIGIENIQKRITSLAQWTLDELLPLKHDNGTSLIELYGTSDLSKRGATITFNVKSSDGKVIFYEEIESNANKLGISLRAGCFCNPGLSEIVGQFTPEMLRPVFECEEKTSYKKFVHAKKEEFVVGAIRASFGYVSNFKDAYTLVNYIKSYLNK